MTEHPYPQRRPHPPTAADRKGCLHHLSRWLLALLGLVALGGLYEAVSEASDARTYRPPGQLIDVGGHRLHLSCLGTGRPTVVIDAGLGDWSTPWTQVQAQAANTTRVCTYDRAGMGFSEPGVGPRTAERFAGELHTLLQRSGTPGPYVLVGHSMGGLTVRMFTHHHPAEVAGVVLIESMSPQVSHTSASPAPSAASHSPLLSLAALAARIGLVRALAGPLGLRDGLPAQVAPVYAALLVTPRYFTTTADEAAGLPESLRQAATVTTFGDLPLTVLSRGLDPRQDWQAQQSGLLRLSSRSRHLFAKSSGHNIERDQPDAAVQAIVKMVRALRP